MNGKTATLVLYMCNSVYSFSKVNKGYVPDGLSKSEWEELKLKEKRNKSKNYAVSGISKGFKSRSLNEFFGTKRKGLADYNMPVFNAREKLL